MGTYLLWCLKIEQLGKDLSKKKHAVDFHKNFMDFHGCSIYTPRRSKTKRLESN